MIAHKSTSKRGFRVRADRSIDRSSIVDPRSCREGFLHATYDPIRLCYRDWYQEGARVDEHVNRETDKGTTEW